MKRLIFAAAAVGTFLGMPAISHATPKSALDGLQFDGVASDAVLKTANRTRRQWLDSLPVQAREYWRAWDCKGKPCDSKWQADIRAKAALISRTDKDPPPSNTSTKSDH